MVILSKFAENLLALMEEHNINAPALAEKQSLTNPVSCIKIAQSNANIRMEVICYV